MIRSKCLLTCALFALLFPVHSSAQDNEIMVAVRDDVRPFVWQDDHTKDYTGFLYDICYLAVQKAGYFPKRVPITANDRKAFLDTGARGYDLLCDPTTMALSRMRKFVTEILNLTFSPIVFLANGSYVVGTPKDQNRVGAGKIKDLSAYTQSTLCKTVLEHVREESEKDEATPGPQEDGEWLRLWPKPSGTFKQSEKQLYEIWGYLAGSTSETQFEDPEALKRVNDNNAALICPKAFPSHKEAANAFCTGGITRYYGDAEIITDAIKTYTEGRKEKCTYTQASVTTYEPYAFVVSSRNHEDFPRRFTLALYEMFADQTIDRLFAAYFNQEKSDYLATLFRINRIPVGVPAPPPQ